MTETPVQVAPKDDDAPPKADPAEQTVAGSLSLIDWFVPPHGIAQLSLRQRIHVYVIAHLAGAAIGLALAVVLYAAAFSIGVDLQWLALIFAGFALLPFGLKLTRRLDVMGAVSAQCFALVILLVAHDYGGLLSPALPWIVMAFSTTFYYLAPWPRWRSVNLALQVAQIAVFVIFHLYGVEPGLALPAQTLLVVAIASSCAEVTLISVISFHVWSMDQAKQRELEREMAVRHTVEAEQKRAEDELRRSRDHLAQSQRVARIGSAEVVYQPVFAAYWSEALYDLFGVDKTSHALSRDEFLARVHADDRTFVRMRQEREVRGVFLRAHEFRIQLPDGGQRWIRRQAEPIEWHDGRPARAIATYLDVTEQKDAQEAVVDLEEQLAQAHKMEAIGQLTGGVAHDFNNLLAVLLGRLQMVDEELRDPHLRDTALLRDWVRSCIRAVDRGATLTKSMLAFSRQQALAPVILDVNAVVADMEEMLHRALGEAYQLHVMKAPDLWYTEADAGQLQGALLNLVLNARDAAPDGGTLTIETRNSRIGPEYIAHHMDAGLGDYVELVVSDTGTGMAPEIVKRAFEPFFTTKEIGKGSGLGLSMVYGFVTQSGGHVAIDSEVGRGTTVRVYLPRKEGAAVVQSTSPEAPSVNGQLETILVVEDNDELRDVTRRQIARMGYTVIVAAHAAEGLDMLRAHPETKLLVSDVVLPLGMNGVEMAEAAMVLFPDLRVVFMSGYNEEHEAFKRIQGRFPLRLLQKPFQPSELAAQIRAALNTSPHNPV